MYNEIILGFLVQMLKRLAKKGFVVLRDKPKFRKRFDTAKKRVTTLKKYLIFIDIHIFFKSSFCLSNCYENYCSFVKILGFVTLQKLL